MTLHVDNLKILHKDPKCMTKTIQWLSSLYRNLKEQMHNNLGNTQNYKIQGVVCISIVEFIKEMIKSFPEEISSKAASQTANCLF